MVNIFADFLGIFNAINVKINGQVLTLGNQKHKCADNAIMNNYLIYQINYNLDQEKDKANMTLGDVECAENQEYHVISIDIFKFG